MVGLHTQLVLNSKSFTLHINRAAASWHTDHFILVYYFKLVELVFDHILWREHLGCVQQLKKLQLLVDSSRAIRNRRNCFGSIAGGRNQDLVAGPLGALSDQIASLS